MKYSPQQYASALYEAVKGKTAEESVTVLNNFSALLKKNRDTALARKIAEALAERGHQIKVLTTEIGKNKEILEGVEIERLPKIKDHISLFILKILKAELDANRMK